MSLTSYRAAPPRVGDVSVFDPVWWPGADRLSRALRRSTMGAEWFHGRVRDGIGCGTLARGTRPPGRIKGVTDELVRGWCVEGVGYVLVLRAVRGISPHAVEEVSSIGRLGPLGCDGYPSSTCGLST